MYREGKESSRIKRSAIHYDIRVQSVTCYQFFAQISRKILPLYFAMRKLLSVSAIEETEASSKILRARHSHVKEAIE